ncbi:MAG: tetraacyldisaccharide 4'-kinase [Rhodospirillales bacterium]|nr:tetraacyldisaccharide 4'-kinase [Rhodospirillales bacterium]
MRAPEFWRRGGGLFGGLLAPLGWGYGLGTWLRFAFTKPYRSDVPVLCIGNLVAGGAGKTPVALSLGGYLAERGLTVHYLGRGYGGIEKGPLRVDLGAHGAGDVGDEALLLAAVAPTWISVNRAAGVEAAGAGADFIIMDDGFQNPSVAKDLSLVVVDGRYGFGNERLIPAGPLREPVARALDRAHALIVIGEDEAGIGGHPKVKKSNLPVLKATVTPGPEASALKGKAVVAFAGIGEPEKFFRTLSSIGGRVQAAHAFPDHHRYTTNEIQRLKQEAADMGAILVTTTKDAVRLAASDLNGIEVLTISLEWRDETALDAVLNPIFGV